MIQRATVGQQTSSLSSSSSPPFRSPFQNSSLNAPVSMSFASCLGSVERESRSLTGELSKLFLSRVDETTDLLLIFEKLTARRLHPFPLYFIICPSRRDIRERSRSAGEKSSSKEIEVERCEARLCFLSVQNLLLFLAHYYSSVSESSLSSSCPLDR